MVLHKENRKPPCIKKAGIVLSLMTLNVHLKPLKDILLTHRNMIKIAD